MNKYDVRQACAATVMMDTVTNLSTTTAIISAYQKQIYWEIEEFCCTMYIRVKFLESVEVFTVWCTEFMQYGCFSTKQLM